VSGSSTLISFCWIPYICTERATLRGNWRPAGAARPVRVDRVAIGSAQINRRGISRGTPSEVEQVLASFQEVQGAHVIGLDHADRAPSIEALVEKRYA